MSKNLADLPYIDLKKIKQKLILSQNYEDSIKRKIFDIIDYKQNGENDSNFSHGEYVGYRDFKIAALQVLARNYISRYYAGTWKFVKSPRNLFLNGRVISFLKADKHRLDISFYIKYHG